MLSLTLDRKRWSALCVLCLGVLMIVLDSTIVNVALPSIRQDLGFTETSLVWVVNAYMLTFGGFLLLGARFGDLYGHRKLFLIGTMLFTIASLACGLANTQSLLIIARAVQGLGGAVVVAVALSLIMNMFPNDAERAKAMGVYGFVCAGGGSLGLLFGGMLTDAFGWHWIFLVNLPIGIAVYALCVSLVPNIRPKSTAVQVDAWGAITVTMSLVLAVYAIVNGNHRGWGSIETLGLLVAATFLFVVFLIIERRVPRPLVPLSIFRLRNLTIASVVGILWSAGMFAWFFISALYMQLILGFEAMQVGLAFLPSSLIMAVFSLGLSARLVARFGIRKPLGVGLLLGTVGFALFARVPVNGNLLTDIFPSMILLGLGAGMALNPLLIASMSDVRPSEYGLASGIINTAFMMGGALGLAIIVSASDTRTNHMLASGATADVALTAGYQLAFFAGAFCAAAAGLCGVLFLRTRTLDSTRIAASGN